MLRKRTVTFLEGLNILGLTITAASVLKNQILAKNLMSLAVIFFSK